MPAFFAKSSNVCALYKNKCALQYVKFLNPSFSNKDNKASFE